MVRVALVCVAYPRTQGVMTMLPCIAGCFRLRSKRATESLPAGKFQHVIRDGRSFRTALWSWFNVYVWHL